MVVNNPTGICWWSIICCCVLVVNHLVPGNDGQSPMDWHPHQKLIGGRNGQHISLYVAVTPVVSMFSCGDLSAWKPQVFGVQQQGHRKPQTKCYRQKSWFSKAISILSKYRKPHWNTHGWPSQMGSKTQKKIKINNLQTQQEQQPTAALAAAISSHNPWVFSAPVAPWPLSRKFLLLGDVEAHAPAEPLSFQQTGSAIGCKLAKQVWVGISCNVYLDQLWCVGITIYIYCSHYLW